MKLILLCTLLISSAYGQNKPKYTDAQIIQLLATINTSEMKLAHYADKVSGNEEVERFAEQMLKDHAAGRERITKFARDNGMTLASSAKSEDMKMRGNAKLDQLKELKGRVFDKRYIDIQVNDHKDLLAELDGTLIPQVKDEQLEAMLRQTRETVNGHLQHAEKLQATFK